MMIWLKGGMARGDGNAGEIHARKERPTTPTVRWFSMMVLVGAAFCIDTCRGESLHSGINTKQNKPFAIVRPIEGGTTLALVEEGLNVLRSIQGPVVPVVMIGPYRSGKSFTLNQLMDVRCDEGFGVGHTRKTQTKGIWVWGEPHSLSHDDSSHDSLKLVFVDTEGFESTGKADVYDDRIFALSTLMSQILIYNLPETIRESDLEKLSFAQELAKAFYSSPNGKEHEVRAIQPGSMIWLIQRDFLEGDDLQKTLINALKQVDNPNHDPGIDQLNSIRQSLEAISKSSVAIGLPQPHLDRTKLCDLDDSLFDPKYRTERERLRSVVRQLASPKTVRGVPLDGPGLAELIQKTVTALNDREIPNSGSLVQYFNRDLVNRCKIRYNELLSRQLLPVEESRLDKIAEEAAKTVLAEFERDRFGTDIEGLQEGLKGLLKEELEARRETNELASAKACEHVEMECEAVLERESSQKLPSMGRFTRKYDSCKAKFAKLCIGPGKAHNLDRLEHAWNREFSRFQKEFNDKLLNGIIIMAIAIIVVFRFIIKWTLGETAGWILFIFLQVYPRTFLGSSSSMFDTRGWKALVKGWEFVVNNPIIDLEQFGIPMLFMMLVMYVFRRRLLKLLQHYKIFRKASKYHETKDLDV